MTDRVRTLTVILDRDYRDDDAEVLMQSIRLMRGVEDVALGPIVDGSDHIAREVAKTELRKELIDLLHPNWKGTRT